MGDILDLTMIDTVIDDGDGDDDDSGELEAWSADDEARKIQSSAAMQREPDKASQSEEIPEMFRWMTTLNAAVWCKEQGSHQAHKAYIVKAPFKLGDSWKVNIKWDWTDSTEDVLCSCCKSITMASPDGRYNLRTRGALMNDDGQEEEDDNDRKPPAKKMCHNNNPQVATVTSTIQQQHSRVASASHSSNADSKEEGIEVLPQNCKSPQAFLRSYKALVEESNCDPSEVKLALQKVGPPYGLQNTMLEIQNAQNNPSIGMKVADRFDGRMYSGQVIEGPVERQADDGIGLVTVWIVEFEDGDIQEYEKDELYRIRKNRPRAPMACLGRPFHCLEIFCGQGTVSGAFLDRKWKGMRIVVSRRSSQCGFCFSLHSMVISRIFGQ